MTFKYIKEVELNETEMLYLVKFNEELGEIYQDSSLIDNLNKKELLEMGHGNIYLSEIGREIREQILAFKDVEQLRLNLEG